VTDVGECVELVIDSLAAGGDGVGRADGRVLFVPRTAPGDRVRVELVSQKRRFAHARLVELLEPGPGRREPPCRYAERCGGCAWLHLEESVQERARCAAVRDALQRIAGLSELPEIEEIASPLSLGYRSRARLAFAPGRLGFRAAGSHEVVDVARCAVLDEPTQAQLTALRSRLSRLPRGGGEVEIRGFDSVVRVGDHTYQVEPGAFFQPNGALWAPWLEAVVGACGRGARLVELYAGVGFYTVALLERFESVIAVERSRAARDLVRNTGERAQVEHASCESFASAKLAGLAPDVVLLNPPRAGAHADVCDAIVRARPRRVVYVSCDAATLARDVARLQPAFRVERIRVMHALPQTPHTETICSLVSVDTPSTGHLECERPNRCRSR
jgi:23S rRNA (uracil1939-C5)-methyltransferase